MDKTKTGVRDKKNVEITTDKKVRYTDPTHKVFNETGIVRQNLDGVWEVINDDIQSGGPIAHVESIEVTDLV